MTALPRCSDVDLLANGERIVALRHAACRERRVRLDQPRCDSHLITDELADAMPPTERRRPERAQTVRAISR